MEESSNDSRLVLPTTPHINGRCVSFLPEQKLWRSVPKCYHLVGIWSAKENKANESNQRFPTVSAGHTLLADKNYNNNNQN